MSVNFNMNTGSCIHFDEVKKDENISVMFDYDNSYSCKYAACKRSSDEADSRMARSQ